MSAKKHPRMRYKGDDGLTYDLNTLEGCKAYIGSLEMEVEDYQAALEAALRKKRGETTSSKVAAEAARILRNPKSTMAERKVAASALTQARNK